MRHFDVSRLFFLLLAAPWLAVADTAADELIKEVQQRYNGARTLSVDFVENYSMQGHPRPPETGTLTLRKQGKMRWDYRRPEGKLFVSDGKTVYLYTARDNRVEKVPLKDTEDMRAPLAFLLGRLDMKKEFRDFRLHEGEGGTWLDAAAKNDRVPYEKLEMLIAPGGSVRELKVVGRDESLLSFSFENEKLNPPVADQIFHFTIPPGAEVVDSLEFGSGEK
ncbi:MAG: outer membrane lipoprotein carrier protein LolA [Acidobacteriaceae bacterium]|nr:outer membrane lipoprotein carrier protein LolA [Acidobacteriaceae bacterium]MBV9765113.1 outer membrane lipoprotein carrier protein LolA [Acidobacteriaceae bacterium]